MYFSTSASHLQTHVSLLTSLCPACAGYQKETQEVISTCDNAATSACCASLEPPSGAPFNNGTAVRDTSLIAVVVFQMTDWLTIQQMADFSFFCFVLFSRSLLFSIQQPSCRDRSGLNGFKGHYDRKYSFLFSLALSRCALQSHLFLRKSYQMLPLPPHTRAQTTSP